MRQYGCAGTGDEASRTGAARRKRRLASLLVSSTILGGASLFVPAATYAQQQPAGQTVGFDIPAQPLSSAINAFVRATGWEVGFTSQAVAGKQSSPVVGSMPPAQALRTLLAGTAVSAEISGPSTAALVSSTERVAEAHDVADGSLVLDTITISGAGGSNPADIPYETPGSSDYISGEQIERYKGTSPADIFKGTPSVLSGGSRSNGGIDPNIQGIQGMGRVAVTVDGASNATTVYQGYQGPSSRSYIDPDFIGGISIQKGPSTGVGGAGAIGGSISISTVTVDDIIPEGASQAIRIKTEIGTNTSEIPPVGTTNLARDTSRRTGELWTTTPTGVASPPIRDIDRPGFLLPTGASGSMIYASRSENFDLVLGAARRKHGNYHVGANGGGAPRRSDTCDTTTDPYLLGLCARGSVPYKYGVSTYLSGEQVLNTSQDIFSTLAKATLRYEDHSLELIQTHYDTIYGETYPWGFVVDGAFTDQNVLSRNVLNTYAARYRWNPDDDRFDLRWNTSYTNMYLEAPNGVGGSQLTDNKSSMFSTDISNKSIFTTGLGDLSLTYGASLRRETTGPGGRSGDAPRDGERTEGSVSANLDYNPVDWLRLDGGLRYHRYEAKDNNFDSVVDAAKGKSAWGYHIGASAQMTDWFQPYVSYSNASRMPSLWESVSNGFITISPDLQPETARTWQVGVNINKNGVFSDNDALKVKANYFHNTIDDYIYRRAQRTRPYPQLPNYEVTVLDLTNLAQARFSGIEISGRYERGTFNVELAGTYYTDVLYCRTTSTCANSSLATDYSTNHVPPKFSASLTLNKTFLDDRLLLSGRATYHGKRAAAHEDTPAGANPLIGMIPWRPVLLFDAYAEYKIGEYSRITLSAENLTDQYYIDPLSINLAPSPGRTIKLGYTTTLSDDKNGNLGFFDGWSTQAAVDWSGVYLGGTVGFSGVSTRNEDYYRTITQISNGNVSESGPFFFDNGSGSDWLAEARVGYDHQFANNFVLGGSFETALVNIGVEEGEARGTAAGLLTPKFKTRYHALGSANIRAGLAMGKLLAYGKGGVAIASISSYADVGVGTSSGRGFGIGYSAGAGLEYALSENVSLVGEYQHMRLWGPDVTGSASGGRESYEYRYSNRSTINNIKLGLNYRF